MSAQIDAACRESVETEVNRRLDERGVTVEVQPADISGRQIRARRDVANLMLTSDVNG